jgi:protein-S-isoprenylcysteine O-methyltransferase Ste14
LVSQWLCYFRCRDLSGTKRWRNRRGFLTSKTPFAGIRDRPLARKCTALIALTTLLLGLVLDWFLPPFILRGLFGFWTRLVLGGILIAAGIGIAIAAVRSFRRAGTNVEPWKPTVTLVTSGIFAWMRNPMYTGVTMFLAGLAIALGSDWMLVLLLPAVLILHFGVVKREERYLEAKFGESYRSYMRRVSRYWV